jgi:hypothetical protein
MLTVRRLVACTPAGTSVTSANAECHRRRPSRNRRWKPHPMSNLNEVATKPFPDRRNRYSRPRFEVNRTEYRGEFQPRTHPLRRTCRDEARRFTPAGNAGCSSARTRPAAGNSMGSSGDEGRERDSCRARPGRRATWPFWRTCPDEPASTMTRNQFVCRTAHVANPDSGDNVAHGGVGSILLRWGVICSLRSLSAARTS